MVLWSVTWTWILFGWYIGKIAGPLKPGLILEYLSGGNCYVVWLQCFRDIGKKCVLNLNAGETYTPVQSPESGMETVARMPFFSHCQVAVVPYDMVVQVRGCTRMRGCAGNGHSPGETQDARELGVPPGER